MKEMTFLGILGAIFVYVSSASAGAICPYPDAVQTIVSGKTSEGQIIGRSSRNVNFFDGGQILNSTLYNNSSIWTRVLVLQDLSDFTYNQFNVVYLDSSCKVVNIGSGNCANVSPLEWYYRYCNVGKASSGPNKGKPVSTSFYR